MSESANSRVNSANLASRGAYAAQLKDRQEISNRPLPTEPTIQARLAFLTFEKLRSAGIPIDRVAEEIGLWPSQTSSQHNRIAFHKHATLLEVASRELGDPCYGMHLGSSLALKDLDLLGYICLNSATLGDCLLNLTRYCRVLSDGFDQVVVEDADGIAVVTEVLDKRAVGMPQSTELRLSLYRPMLSALIGKAVNILRYEMPHSQVGPLTEYQTVYHAPVQFNAMRTAVIIGREMLDLAIAEADHGLLKILTRHADEILERRPGTNNLSHSVRTAIASRLQAGETSIGDVSRELGMSSRTLARRLHEHGLSYRDLLNQLRHDLALRYLTDGNHTHAQIAYLLGFTDVSAFSHAFKRWTGLSPSQYMGISRATNA